MRCQLYPEHPAFVGADHCPRCTTIRVATPEQIAQARAHARTIAHTNRKDQL